MILLFLDKYYVTNSEEVVTVYGLLKDFLVPILVLVATITGSVWLSTRDVKRRLKLEQEQEENKNTTIAGIIELANENIIEDLKNIKQSIEENISSLNFEKFDDFSHPRFKKSQFNILVDIGYEKVYELAILERKIDPNIFVKYWSAISECTSDLETVEKYSQYITSEYNRINITLNDILNKINILCADYVYKNLELFSNNEMPAENSEEPKMALAIQCNNIRNRFYYGNNSYFVKLKCFLEELNNLNQHPHASKALSSKFTHMVINAQHYITSFEKLFQTATDVLNNYSKSIAKTNRYISEFQEIFIQKKQQLENL